MTLLGCKKLEAEERERIFTSFFLEEIAIGQIDVRDYLMMLIIEWKILPCIGYIHY